VAQQPRKVRFRHGKTASSSSDDGGFVHSIDRALALLEILGEDEDGYRLVDLAQRAGLSPSTTHRLLTTLERRRFVQFDRESSLWHVGVQCFSVGANFARRRNFVAQALPYMRQLRDAAGETVNLGVADQGEVVFLTQVESRELMRAITRPGGRSPMHCSGMGKALLSSLPEEEVSEILHRHGMRRMTAHSIVRPAKLHAALAEVRRTGFAVDDEEHAIGLRCVASVIYDEYSHPLAAVSVSGPTARVQDRRIGDLGRLVVRSALDITVALGGRAPEH
jgi:IclR family acetate operon transcriptional repressor